jgi:hypothetical protein
MSHFPGSPCDAEGAAFQSNIDQREKDQTLLSPPITIPRLSYDLGNGAQL